MEEEEDKVDNYDVRNDNVKFMISMSNMQISATIPVYVLACF